MAALETLTGLLNRIGIDTPAQRRAERAERAEALRDGTHMGNLRALAVEHPRAFVAPTPEVLEAIRMAQAADAEAARADQYRPGTVRRVRGVAMPDRPRLTPDVGAHRPCSRGRHTLTAATLAGIAEDGALCLQYLPGGVRCRQLYTAGISHREDRTPSQQVHVTDLVCPAGHIERTIDGG